MRRIARLAAVLTLAAAPALGASPPAAPAQRSTPPQSWLFGTWTGGLFPVAPSLAAQTCRTQPVVVFTPDVVAHAFLVQPGMAQRVVETASVDASRVEFRFVPASDTPAGVGAQLDPAAAGFGCESPDVLHVQRDGANEITFPGCKDFPNPLVRCPSG
jgi:hypothetical protein